MVVDELLREFETLPYAARMRRMVELGRRAGQDADVAALCVRRLHAFRQDAAPLVAAAAQFTFPPGEE